MEKTPKKTVFTREDFVRWGRAGGRKSVEKQEEKGVMRANLARARELKKAKMLDKGVQTDNDGSNDGDEQA